MALETGSELLVVGLHGRGGLILRSMPLQAARARQIRRCECMRVGWASLSSPACPKNACQPSVQLAYREIAVLA